MRLVVEEILDAAGARAVRVDLASVDRVPVGFGDDLWISGIEDPTKRRRMKCVDVRMLVSSSGVVGIVDVIAFDADFFTAAATRRLAARVEEAPIVARPCACGNPGAEDFEHGSARCAQRRPLPLPPPPPANPRIIRATGAADEARPCACGHPTDPGYRHGAERCLRDDVAAVAETVARKKAVPPPKLEIAPEEARVVAMTRNRPEASPKIRFISPPGVPERCPICGDLYKHVEHPTKPGVIMMSLCKCEAPAPPGDA